MFETIDNFFCGLEGKRKATSATNATTRKPGKGKSKKVLVIGAGKINSLGSAIHHLYVSKGLEKVSGLDGLDGWKDDKEKFKIDLLNDIKTFLFTKWEKPWKPGLIFNANGDIISGFRNIHGRVYTEQGNVIGLERNKGNSPFFITVSDLEKKGGTITDKNKRTTILSYVPISEEIEKGGEKKSKIKFMLPKFHSVINVDYVEGIKKPDYKTEQFKGLELNEYVENFIKELVKLNRVPKLIYDQSDRCYYTHKLLSWDNDRIHLVPINNFKDIEGYYSTLFHEIIHSTMNPNRCGRGKNGNTIKLDYPNEELVAEMGAMIICSELGLNYNRQNSITYLKGWLTQAGNDKDTAMIEAYAFACDAADYLMKDINLEKLVPKSMKNRIQNPQPEPEKPKKNSRKKAAKQVREKSKKVAGRKKKGGKAPFKNFLPRTEPDELNYELARRAHYWTSFEPEKRAKQHQNDFANGLNNFAEQIEGIVSRDEQKEIAIEEFSRYKNKFASFYKAWLQAKSKCMSSMITGGSNFPVRKAEKANQVEHKRMEELIAFEEKAQKAILAKVKGKTPKDILNAERWAKIEKQLTKDIATIIGIDQGKIPGYSKTLFVNSLKRFIAALHKNGQFEDTNKSLAMVREAQEKFNVVVFAPNNAVWKLENTTPATPMDKPAENLESKVIFNADGCEVVNNFQMERVQILFPGKPDKEIVEELKRNSFKWAPSQKAWQRHNTTAGINAALKITNKFFKPTEAEPEKKTSPATPADEPDFKAPVNRKQEQGNKDDSKSQEGTKNNATQLTLFGIDDVNSQFNRELEQLIKGDLSKGHVFYLGETPEELHDTGMPYLPIEMQAQRLNMKSKAGHHIFDLNNIKDLPLHVQTPIGIFQSLRREQSKVLFIELHNNGVNFIVAIEAGGTSKSRFLSVNSIRSIYPKDNIKDILEWITEYNLLERVCQKQKFLDWLNKQQCKSADVKKLIKESIKIIQNFENSKSLDGIATVEEEPSPINPLEGFGLAKLGTGEKPETYQLQGGLGEFLGEYDRLNYSIVLRGEKGAGKSRLLFQLIDAFAAEKLKIAFLSLEMHPDSLVSCRYRDEYIKPENYEMIDVTSQVLDYDGLNRLCKMVDVVAIDSWTKLKGMGQDDFDRLQKENPSTIILSVFQSTSGKVTRGGNMPEFDAGTVIQVNKGGLAECEKNRYTATDKIYSVFDRCLVELDKEEK